MKKSSIHFLAAMAMAMAANPYYEAPKRIMRERQRRRYEEYERAKAHAICPINVSEHEFVIHGEKIMSRNKKNRAQNLR